ncbi:sulfatase-like hydrolase/transferase [Pseudobutyrivibrio xylanivorans]|uniref:Phosphoglycerol transferase n=1 Tax=Pseudobutyrivibrio xylanivorans DSM 14809 TaxID=1123012 RepID=A0A1M6JRK3_PSEXY|nr:sulfatase-like hydrolase/transferase [Pseudobutyrivibrio xylanivorans]SHJ49263.1 phosphoglycerol transferase [Pseudobutyrivibrio xylanivorans DSM 14809]
MFYFLTAILVILFAAFSYLRNTWPEVSYSELLFHLKTSFDGTDPQMIYSALLHYAFPAVIAIVVIFIIMHIIKIKHRKLYRIIATAIVFVLFVSNAVSVYSFNKKTRVFSDFISDVLDTNKSDFIGKEYVDPSTVSIKFPETKRNLIYIYLESMEVSFSDVSNGGAFSDNYIPNLTELAKKYEDFSGNDDSLEGGVSLPGTNWTTAALFAETSGLPLDLPVHEGSITNPEQFFPTITTMGDILEKEGYKNVVEMGSSAGFGGLSAYYKGHGNYDIHDYDYAIANGLIPEDYYVAWGYEDEKLFEFAKSEITDLAKSGQPFNYTMFTMDTHATDGYACRLCGNEFGDNQYANVLTCSDRQVTAFVDWIQQQDFYNNTTIVISGDHPTMAAQFASNIPEDYQRKTYTCIINAIPVSEDNTHKEFSTLDLFPTILAALGAEMSSDRLGCGTNLYSPKQTIIEEFGKEYCITEFSKNSSFVESLINNTVDEDVMKFAQDNAYLEVAEEEDGGTRFRLVQADSLNYTKIRELKLIVHDHTTNQDFEYELEREVARSGWKGVNHSDFPFANIQNVDCEIYISIDDFDNYLFKKVPADELGMWDLRWDFD